MTWSSLVPSRPPTSCNSMDQTLERCVLSLGPSVCHPWCHHSRPRSSCAVCCLICLQAPLSRRRGRFLSCTVEPCVPNLPAGAKLVRTIFLGGSGSAVVSSHEHILGDAEDMFNTDCRSDQLPEWVNSALPCASQSVKTETESEAVAGRGLSRFSAFLGRPMSLYFKPKRPGIWHSCCRMTFQMWWGAILRTQLQHVLWEGLRQFDAGPLKHWSCEKRMQDCVPLRPIIAGRR